MEFHLVAPQDLRAKFGDDFAIYGDDAGSDVLIGLAAGTYPGVGEEFIQAHGGFRVEIRLLVCELFLPAVFGIGVIVVCALTVGLALVAVPVVATPLAAALIVVTLVAAPVIE